MPIERSNLKRILDLVSLLTALIAWLYLFIALLPLKPGIHVFWLISSLYFLAAILVDFFSGLIHFLGDNLLVENKFVNNWFIQPFINHHMAPREMTQHDVFKTNGSNALVACLVLLPTMAFFPISTGLVNIGAHVFILFFSGFALLTNQIHKWAHTSKPPKIIKFLQRYRLILNPYNHALHHMKHDRNYCITMGWLNTLFYKTQLYERITRLRRVSSES